MGERLKNALVGYTGFVGGNLLSQHPFEALYNSKNVEEIAGQSFNLLVVSAMPAAMWIANQDPVGDRAVLDRLVGCLKQVDAQRVVLMSTVAVYPKPLDVDEQTLIDPTSQTPYGRHRYMLERFILDHFPTTLTVRLPGLFGNGLKKNAVFDLIHNHELEKINANGVYQFYNLGRLWEDVTTATNEGLRVVNFATEPLSIREVAQGAFDLDFNNDPGSPPARFDMGSIHAKRYGGEGRYLYNKAQVLADLRAFVTRERATASASGVDAGDRS